MISALVADGPNGVKIPIMFWTDAELAKQDCSKLLGEPTSNCYWWVYRETHEEDDTVFLIIPASLLGTEPQNPYAPNAREERELFSLKCNRVPSKSVVTSYYGGCGEIGSFTLKEFDEGKPCIQFNLD